MAERFFAMLKGDLVHDAGRFTGAVATTALFEFIEVWYNRQRRHASLRYRTPAQYEADVLRRARAA